MPEEPIAAIKMDKDLWPVQAQVIQWTPEAADLAIEAWLATRQTLEDNAKAVGPVLLALHPLGASCASTSESALLLVNSTKAWDADVLVRSVLEGSLKFLHLAHGTPQERAGKQREFDVDLPEINRIKRHRRLTEFLASIPNPGADDWKPYKENLLAAEELARLETTYPRQTRQKLDSRWSFGGIVGEMERIPGHPFAMMKHFMHGYGMSSHILHQDSDGIGIVRDRVERSRERRDAVTLGHCARIISDITSMAILRAHAAFLLTGQKADVLAPLIRRWTVLQETLEPAHRQFREVEYRQSAEATPSAASGPAST